MLANVTRSSCHPAGERARCANGVDNVAAPLNRRARTATSSFSVTTREPTSKDLRSLSASSVSVEHGDSLSALWPGNGGPDSLGTPVLSLSGSMDPSPTLSPQRQDNQVRGLLSVIV